MYYVIAKNSENKKTYVSTFKEKREAVSNYSGSVVKTKI